MKVLGENAEDPWDQKTHRRGLHVHLLRYHHDIMSVLVHVVSVAKLETELC